MNTRFIVYMIGTVLVTLGFGYAAYEIGLDSVWIAIISIVIIGFGIMAGVSKTQSR